MSGSRKIARLSVTLWVAVLLAGFQSEGPASPVKAGEVVDVACEADATQTYSLYLPSAYTPTKAWPIVYAFDPLARGKVPVQLYKELAEKYGFVLAGSNGARNFSQTDSVKSINAIWRDTHARLALDERRTYLTGFSGGARLAGQLAIRCRECKIAGVIAHSAGYSNGFKPSDSEHMPYFLATGTEDFNWPEVITVRRQREDLGYPYRVHAFAGSHQWAPPDVMEDALQWMNLKAMQSGAMTPDPAFLGPLIAQTAKDVDDAAKRGDAIAELSALRMLVSDFKGIKNVSVDEKVLVSLKASNALKSALKNEQALITQQRTLEDEVTAEMAGLAEAGIDDQAKRKGDVTREMSRLRETAANAKNDDKRFVYTRAFNGLMAMGIEAGQESFEQKHFTQAEVYFLMMNECSDDPWPSLLLAETHVATGNKKQAIKDLREAIRRGVKNPDVFAKDRNLQSLNGDREYQKLLADLASKQAPSK